MRLITIEFTEDTFREEAQTDDDGNLVLDDAGQPVVAEVLVRSKGDQLHVDPRSARSFCDKKKVAKRIGSTTDDDRSNDQVPATSPAPAAPVGDVDPPAGEQGNEAAGDPPPAEQAATPRSRRGTSTS